MRASTITRSFREWDATHRARFKAWFSMVTILAAEGDGVMQLDLPSQWAYLRRQSTRNLVRIEADPASRRTSGRAPIRIFAEESLAPDLGMTAKQAKRIFYRWSTVRLAMRDNLEAWHTLLDIASAGRNGCSRKAIEYCKNRVPIVAGLLKSRVILTTDPSGTRIFVPDRTLTALRLEDEESTGNHKTPKPADYYRAGM